MNAKQRGRSHVGRLAAWVFIAVATLTRADAQGAADTKLESRAAAELMTGVSELPGWSLAEPPRIVEGQDLFELIDGGAEIYQEYGFLRAAFSRFERGAATLQIELYQMTEAAAAYGVYSMMQSPRGAVEHVGQEARLFRDYLMFWQGDIYASLTVTGEDANAAQALTDAARAIAARISTAGERPAIMRSLPEAELQDRKYLRGPIALSNIHVFGTGDVFGAKEAACGVYADRREFIFSYPSDEAASARLASVREAMGKDGAYRGLTATAAGLECRDADGRRIVAVQDGSRLIVRIREAAAAADR